MESKEISFPIIRFDSYREVDNQYTDEFIKNSYCVKISEDDKNVSIAISEKHLGKYELLNKIHFPKKVIVKKIKDSDFVEFIGNCVEKTSYEKKNKVKNEESFNLEEVNSQAPVVNIINAICLEAIRKQVSDVHIHCDNDFINVRFRIDGVLQLVKRLDKNIFDSFVSRIKVMSKLNVMENRLCQEGRMTVLVDKDYVDFRVSIVPTTTGQSIVLRLFNSKLKMLELEDLGFSDFIYQKIKKVLSLPNGIFLATGPTGSGKTTTLHALLSKLDKEHLKIVTIEDPVERELDGVDQIQVNNELGLTFENILRKVLRQDPDVIMIGEIRDRETAELAVRAALTGHLIFSTLHTNDSISTITRLRNLGIESYLIASVLKYSLAQRIIRKTCTKCNGVGCEYCNFSGFKGRIAIGEILEVTDEISEMIEMKKTDKDIKKFLSSKNFKFLYDDAILKLGVTTKQELLREGLL